MHFASVRVITADVARLTAFYEAVTGGRFTMFTPDFGEMVLPGCTLAIGSTATLTPFGPGVAEAGANRSAILEFYSADVDADFTRLEKIIGAALVQAPTTMPWGNRSLLFRDPDGGLVNLFTPVAEAAKARFAGRLPG